MATAVSGTKLQTNSDADLRNLTICSPEVVKASLQSSPSNIFTSPNSVTVSGNTFGQPLEVVVKTTTQGSIFDTSDNTATTQASIFGAKTTSSLPGFGSLSPTAEDPPKSASISPPTSLLSSLVKPDQSVFSSNSTVSVTAVTAPYTNIFGAAVTPTPSGIFSSLTSQPASSGIFGSPSTTTTTFGTQGSVFGQAVAQNATGGSLFSQSSFAPQPTSPNIFATQATVAPSFGSSVFASAQPSQQTSPGGIFSGQNSFSAQQQNPQSSSIFGGNSAAPSPFGSSSVFGGSATFSNAFGSAFGSSSSSGNSFNLAPTFGQASFGSPKSNLFGQTSPSAPSNNIFEQLGSQQSGNLFGNLAQNSPTQPPPQNSGFSGSAFSSWR